MSCDEYPDSIGDVELKINGRDIPLNAFVKCFIARTVLGMTQSLQGVDNVESIEMKIKIESPD